MRDGDVVTPETVLPRDPVPSLGARMELAPTTAAMVSGPRSPGLVSSDNAATREDFLSGCRSGGPALTRAQNILIGMAQTGVSPVTTGAHIGGYCALRTGLHRLRQLRSVTACGWCAVRRDCRRLTRPRCRPKAIESARTRGQRLKHFDSAPSVHGHAASQAAGTSFPQ